LTPAIVIAVALLSGCGGQKDASDSKTGTAAEQARAVSPHGNKGIGPIKSVDISVLDSTLAGVGAAVFEAKCTACHKIQERYIGPALLGVTTRREPEWIMNMILNPDVMVKEDETAKSLLAEYLAPMTNQNLTEEEARSVLAFFLANDKHIGE